MSRRKRHIAVRMHFGRKRHAIDEAHGDDPMTTLCGRIATAYVIETDTPDCLRCLQEMARGR